MKGDAGWLVHRIINYLVLALLAIGSWYFARNEQRITALELGQTELTCQHVLLAAGAKNMDPCQLSRKGR